MADNPKSAEIPVCRFAPSPNGRLHLGHAYSALLNLRLAREAGGRMLLRIEDIDTQRCTAALEREMLEDLEWLGFEWDEPPIRQSDRFEHYRAVLDALLAEGLVYPATLSRRQIADRVERITSCGKSWPCDPEGQPHYPGDERKLPEREREAILSCGADFSLRLDIAAAMATWPHPLSWQETGMGPEGESGIIAADPRRWGDAVLGRAGLPASYHLACVLDDALQGVTHVVRGRDLFHATSLHRLLQEMLGLPEPLYHHHDLILDETGRKLSKSRSSLALRHLREAGLQPSDIRRMIGL